MKLPKPSKPKLTMSLRRPKDKAEKAEGAEKVVKAKSKTTPSVRVPQPVEDLYRDMRDRRLLLPALALIAAVIAVPVLLSTPAEAPPPPPVLQAPEGAEAVAPAVLTEETIGVRDYRKRLDALKSKNPFEGSFASPLASGGGGDSDEPDTDTATSTTSPPTGGATPTDPATTPTDDLSTTGDAPSSDGGTAGEILILAPRVDVKAGRFGEPKDIEGVELGDLLPDRRKAPVVMLIGVSEDLRHATFLVSDDVSATNGEGSCRPRANDCEFLRLADGEKRTFVYEPNGRKYVVKVTDIREVVVDRRKVEAG
jgi:hypothetical protein